MDTVYFYDSLVAFITFGIVRYTLPNLVLGKDISLWSGLVLSFFYALSVVIRSYCKTLYI